MKKTNPDEIIAVNKGVWAADIKRRIAEWKDYAGWLTGTPFPGAAEHRADAVARIGELEGMLTAVETGAFTRRMFDRIKCAY